MTATMNYTTFLLAGIRNKPGRNLATMFCFAFIAANIFSAQFLMAGAASGVSRGITRMGADQVVVPAQYLVFMRGIGADNTMAIVRVEPSLYRFDNSMLDTVGKLKGVSMVSPQLYVTTLEIPELSSSPVDLFAIDPATDFTIRPWLKKPLEEPLGTGQVLIGNEIPGEVSSQIRINDHVFTVAGKLDPTRSATDHTVFLVLADAYQLARDDRLLAPGTSISPGEINAVLVRNIPGEDPDAILARTRRSLSVLYSPSEVAVIGRHFTLDPVSREVQGIPALLQVISAVVVIATLPLVALIAALVAHERQQEIGLLRAMGAKRKVIFSLILAESLVLAAAGGIAGVAVSLVVFFFLDMQGLLNSALQVSFHMPGRSEIGLMTALALSVVIVIGGISSLWPAYRSSMMNPYDAIRSDGL
jgi:putative ABC transport system permease protein